jgi:alkylated DNA repair protein alkB homolog 8
MHFKQAPSNDNVVESKDLYLTPRSLVIFTGEVRYNWQHSIALRKIDRVAQGAGEKHNSLLKFRHRRVSLTFRKVKADGKPCECRWPKLCDSQNKHLAVV